MGLKDLLTFGRVVSGAAKKIKQQRTDAANLAALDMKQFVPSCLALLNDSHGAWSATLRTPSSSTVKGDFSLPLELQQFYEECDGFEPSNNEFPVPILPISKLRLGAKYSPPLSVQVRKEWEECGREEGEPELVSVFPPNNLSALAFDKPELQLPFETLDGFLPLYKPQEGHCAVIVISKSASLTAGTILDIEGTAATRYNSLREWLAAFAMMFH